LGIRPGISFNLNELRARRGREPSPERLALEEWCRAMPRLPLRTRMTIWVIYALALYGLFCILAAAANAGTCRTFSDGPDVVTSCEDGSFTVRRPSGRAERYGEPNAGFERYPEQPERPVYRRGRGD
jgi:hypothetical protein